MRRFAGAALGAGFAISALVPLTILAGTAGAASGRAAGPLSTAAATPSPTPKTSRSAKPPTGQPTPPPTQRAAPPGPPAPVQGMPQPSATCLSHLGRAHLYSEPWAQRALDFSSVWDLTRGQHVTVAVVDSGIDYTHQLAGRVSRVDLTGGNGEDCRPHGTIVASIIAASDARASGIPFYGVAPAARILSIRVQQQETTKGQTDAQRRRTLADIANGIRYAVAKHAQVINVSIQVSGSYPALRSAVEFALRRNVVVVAAAGNDSPGGGPGPFFPASYPGVLSVNAVDQNGQLGSFDVNTTPVSVTAPGVNVASDYPGGFNPANNGTSFAAAFVSGEAALVRAAYPHMPAWQVRDRIIATAAGRTGAHTGAGMINPVQAVTAVLPQHPAPTPPEHLVPIPHPRAVNSYTRTVALSVTAGALTTAALVAIGAVVVPHGRRRHWRPGRLAPATATGLSPTVAPEPSPTAARPPRQPRPLPPTAERPPIPPAPAPAPAPLPNEAEHLPGASATPASRRRFSWPSRGTQHPDSGGTARQPPPEPATAPARPPATPAQPPPLPPDTPPSTPSQLPDMLPPTTYGALPPDAPPDRAAGGVAASGGGPDLLLPTTYGALPASPPSQSAPGLEPLPEPFASPNPPPASPLPSGPGRPHAPAPPTEYGQVTQAEPPAAMPPPPTATPPTATRPPRARHRHRRK